MSEPTDSAATLAEVESLRDELAALRSQAAAMREALHLADGCIEHRADCAIGFEANSCDCDALDIQAAVEAALATDAGPAFWREVRADVLEEAALVAESYEPECESCPRGCASAIRELKGDA